MSASPTTIISGQTTTLTWITANATSVAISPAVGTAPLATSGTATVGPTQTTTYTLTATSATGKTTTATLQITVNAPVPQPATVTLTFDRQLGAPQQTANLTWNTSNAASITITPSILGEDQTELALSGTSAILIPAQDTTYTATVVGTDGKTVTATATIQVLNVGLTATPGTINSGDPVTLSWTSTHADSLTIDGGIGTVAVPAGTSQPQHPTQTTTYTITATSGTISTTAQVVVNVNSTLKVTLAATPTNILAGASSTLSWTSQNAVSLSIDNGIGSVAVPSSSQPVKPTLTTTYTITATNATGGTQTATATVTVSPVSGDLNSNVKHVIVLVQENRSFDSYFSQLGAYATSKGIANYSINAGYDPNILIPTQLHKTGACTPTDCAHPFHYTTTRTENLSPSWNESHFDIDQQKDGSFKMDRFMLTTNSVAHAFDNTGVRAMGYYDQTDLPYYYEVATKFATSDSFHSPLLSNTVPNRQFLFCATSQGRIRPSAGGHPLWTCPTIFSSLTNANVNFQYFFKDGVLLSEFSDWNNLSIQHKVSGIQNYFDILAAPDADTKLAPFVFIEGGQGKSGLDEHPLNNVQKGAAFVKTIIDALMNSTAWHDSVFILAYDEGGGLYDHVAPFAVVAPDTTPPELVAGDLPGDFTLSGFRVPIMVISPFAKPNFVSHTNRDLTSILRFVETRFALPPLTARDASYAPDDFLEFFDFTNPAYLTPPALPDQPIDLTKDAPQNEAPFPQ